MDTDFSTYFRIGSKFRCMRSTPTEMQSMSENDFECFASTGVNTPGTMFPDSRPANIRFPRSRLELSRWCDGRYRVSWGQQFWRWLI